MYTAFSSVGRYFKCSVDSKFCLFLSNAGELTIMPAFDIGLGVEGFSDWTEDWDDIPDYVKSVVYSFQWDNEVGGN